MALTKPTGAMLNAGATSAPAALGTAAAGTSQSYSRADHVHAMPSAGDVGAIPTSQLSSLASLTGGHLTTSQIPALGGDITLAAGAVSAQVVALRGSAIAATTPTSGQILQWDGTQWTPSTASTGGGGGANGLTYYLRQDVAADAPTTGLPNTPKQLGRTGSASETSITTGTLTSGVWTLVGGYVSESTPIDPATTELPGGLWDFNLWAFGDANSNAGTVIRAKVYVYNGADAPTLIGTSGEQVINGVSAQYSLSVLVPQTTIVLTDRIYVAIEAKASANNHNVTLQFGDGTPSHVHTSLPLVGGTGLWKSIAGVLQSPATLVVDADVDATAGIAVSKIAGAATTAQLNAITAASLGALSTAQAVTIGQGGTGATTAAAALTALGAQSVVYDNTGSSLSATTIVGALNEIAPKKIRNATKGTYFNSIQAAIDDANNNDIITLAAGRYLEEVYIWKPLTLRGPNYDKRGDDASRIPEAILEYKSSIIAGNSMISADVDNVTIEGLDLRYPDTLLKAGHNANVTFTDAGDLVTCNSHGFANGDTLMFSVKATTTGISTFTSYYVISATTNTFQLSLTSGGSALPLTNNGTGTILGAAGSLYFSYAINNLTLRNNRWYSSEIPIYIYPNLPFQSKTGGLIEGNYVDCGPFVNSSSSSRAIYCADLSVTIQDNVIANSCIGIQVSQSANPTASLVQRNTVSAAISCFYNNLQHFGSGSVTWKNNTGTLAPNDRSGLKTRIAVPLAVTSALSAIWLRSMAIDNSYSGASPTVVFTNNLIDLSLDPSKIYNNTTAVRAVRYQDVKKGVTATINNNSIIGWTVAARSDATAAVVIASSIDASLANNWWGTATASKLVLESTVASGSITASPVLAGQRVGDGAALLKGSSITISNDVNYDNTTSGLAATNVKLALDLLAAAVAGGGGGSGAPFSVQWALNKYVSPVNAAVAAGGAAVANTIYLMPFVAPRSFSFSELGARVTTAAATSNFQLAIYASSGSLLPTGTPIGNTASLSGVTATALSGSATGSLTSGSLYWMACNQDVSTLVFQTIQAASLLQTFTIGASTMAIATNGNSSATSWRQIASTFGTWPDLTSSTTTETAGSQRTALIYMKISALA